MSPMGLEVGSMLFSPLKITGHGAKVRRALSSKTQTQLALVGDDEDEDDEDEAPLTMRSMNRGKHDKFSTPDLNTGTGFSFEEAPDGGSGVGFFELEEELQSPAMSPRRSPNRNHFGYFDDWGAVPDEEDQDKDKDNDRDTEMTG